MDFDNLTREEMEYIKVLWFILLGPRDAKLKALHRQRRRWGARADADPTDARSRRATSIRSLEYLALERMQFTAIRTVGAWLWRKSEGVSSFEEYSRVLIEARDRPELASDYAIIPYPLTGLWLKGERLPHWKMKTVNKAGEIVRRVKKKRRKVI